MVATNKMASERPQQIRAPFWVRTLFNPLAKLILGSPLHGVMSQRLLLITFTGRKTGRRFTTPISYLREGNVLTLGVGGSWWKNLRDGGQIQVRLRGRKRTGVTEVVTDEASMYEAYQVILAHNPTQARFMGITMDADGRPNPGALRQALRRRSAVVRIRLTD
ncbi:MAG: nitroreductase/quinone reductase family protein [Nitrososphaerota archaeon]